MTITLSNCQVLADADTPVAGPRDIVIAAGRIRDIRQSGTAPAEGRVIDATGRLVTAGLINGHQHSHEHFHKGRYDNLPLELWMHFVRPPDPPPLTARQVYLRTMIGAIECLRSGATTLIDDLNVSPVLNPDHVEAVCRAYDDIGIRALVGPSLFDRPFYRAAPFVEEELPPALLKELDAKRGTPPHEVLAFVRELADRYTGHERLGCIVAPSAPQRCSDDFLVKVRELADELALPVITHVHETRLQAVTAQRFYGATMFRHLHDLGFLKPRTSLIHAVWLTPGDVDLVAESGATVQHNPGSNLRLGSGVAPLRALLDAGVNVSLGSDGCGSTDTVSMLRVVNLAALIHKGPDVPRDRWIGAREAWACATRGGAAAIGRAHDLGQVRPGYVADLTAYRLDRIPFVPLNDPLRQLVYAESGAALDMVLVGGEPVMMDGRLCRVDEEALLAEIADAHRALEPLISAAEEKTEALRAAYGRILDRCSRSPIPDCIGMP